MVATVQMAGVIAFGAMFLAIVVLGLVSWAKNRRRRPGNDEEHGGSTTVTDSATPGDWDSGSHGEL